MRRPCIYLLLTADPLIFFIVASLLVVFIRSHRIFTRGVSLESPCPWLCYEPSLAIPRLLQEDQSVPTSSTIVSNSKSMILVDRFGQFRLDCICKWRRPSKTRTTANSSVSGEFAVMPVLLQNPVFSTKFRRNCHLEIRD